MKICLWCVELTQVNEYNIDATITTADTLSTYIGSTIRKTCVNHNVYNDSTYIFAYQSTLVDNDIQFVFLNQELNETKQFSMSELYSILYDTTTNASLILQSVACVDNQLFSIVESTYDNYEETYFVILYLNMTDERMYSFVIDNRPAIVVLPWLIDITNSNQLDSNVVNLYSLYPQKYNAKLTLSQQRPSELLITWNQNKNQIFGTLYHIDGRSIGENLPIVSQQQSQVGMYDVISVHGGINTKLEDGGYAILWYNTETSLVYLSFVRMNGSLVNTVVDYNDIVLYVRNTGNELICDSMTDSAYASIQDRENENGFVVLDMCDKYSNVGENQRTALMYEIKSFIKENVFYLMIVTDTLSMTIYQVDFDLTKAKLIRNIKILYLKSESSIYDINVIYRVNQSTSETDTFIMLSYYDSWEEKTFAQVFALDQHSMELQTDASPTIRMQLPLMVLSASVMLST